MSITALTASGQQSRSLNKSPRLVLNVMAWEFRRFRASRLFWFQALGLFGFFLLITWVLHWPEGIDVVSANGGGGVVSLSGSVAGTSAGGLLKTLPTVFVVPVLLLLFVTADGVTRDVHRRTHELLMTTALPTWAYVWGRYLVGLVMSLALAILLLVSLLGMGWLCHLTVTDYPAPEIGNLLLLWVGMDVPATILVSSLGFALSTLLPRLSTLIKAVVMLAWLVGALVIPLSMGGASALPPASWYVNWDPTSAITARGLLPAYALHPGPTITTEAQLRQFILSVENKVPDLAGWFAPHLGLAGASLLLGLIAALAFKRSRGTLN